MGEHNGAATVGPDAAVELGQGIPHHRRVDDVVDRDRVLVEGVGVEARVVAGGHGHLGQLLDAGAELVHVAPGHHGVVRPHRVAERRRELDGTPRPEGEVRHAELLLEISPLRRPVGEHDDLDQALRDGGRGVLDHELPDTPAVAGGVDPVRPDAQILGQLDRGQRTGEGHEAVDLGLRNPRVGQRTRRALKVQLEGRLVVDAPAVRRRRAHDRHAAVGHGSTRRPSSGPGGVNGRSAR